ncbi:MAG: MFS transporter, partial [Okeania sp. SIO3B3]|nr:MFS transporter [Okeania sp. SIO3B3]
MVALVLLAVLAFTTIYAPQPLLPSFAETFDIQKSQAALLMTVLFFPLSVAPITYGYLLES